MSKNLEAAHVELEALVRSMANALVRLDDRCKATEVRARNAEERARSAEVKAAEAIRRARGAASEANDAMYRARQGR